MRQPTLADRLREMDVTGLDYTHVARIIYGLGGGRPPFVFASANPATLVNAVETVFLFTPPLNPGSDAAVVLVIAEFNAAAIGATGTALQLRGREGTTTAGVGFPPVTMTVAVTAGANTSGIFVGMDTPGAVAGIPYCCTGVVVGATANTVPAAAFIMAMALG
jgi:hypothetical protein